MSHATYNITDDKLKVWFDDRLSEVDYQRSKDAGFAWWPGRKCFAKKWTPEAEDFILSFGIEIEDDDTPDDVEARVARYAAKAEKAEAESVAAQERLDSGRANTERRRRLTTGVAERELGKAEHYLERIQGAISNAMYKEHPDVIYRRIKGLYTDLTRMKKALDGVTNNPRYAPEAMTWPTRWIMHLEDRITYEKALLTANGTSYEALTPERKKAVQPKGPAKNRAGQEIPLFGAVARGGGYSYGKRPMDDADGWLLVIKVNRTSVDTLSCYQDYNSAGKPYTRYYSSKAPACGCYHIMSAEDVR